MTKRVEIKPDILTRAIERAGYAVEEFILKNKAVKTWLDHEKTPTVKQLQAFSKQVHIPFGYLLLNKIPEDKLPIPFFRTGKQMTHTVSPEVYDTVRILKNRQSWLSDFLKDNDVEPLHFIGKYNLDSDEVDITADIRQTLQLPQNWARGQRNWTYALSHLANLIEEAGIVVSFNGVVGQNNKRPISADKCRGFVLVDKYVPFLFVNNNDYKSAQLFTLMHELVHIWLGESAGFDLTNILPADDPLEQLCDRVAAELLVPANLLLEEWQNEQNFNQLARIFKVSSIVVARRALDLNLIRETQFFAWYQARAAYFRNKKDTKKEGGGNYYATQGKRISRRFFGHIEQAVQQGQITYLDAYRLTGMRGKTFDNFTSRNS